MATPQLQRCIQEGMTHHQAGRAAEAAQCYARARALDARSWEAHQYGGMAALMLGRNGEAVQLFRVACVLNPRAAVSAVALGLTLLATGAAEEAERVLRQAVKLDAGNSSAWDNLGLILKSRGAIEEALACHAQAVKTGPKNVMAWVNQGGSLLMTPRVWDAQVSFERALKLEPGNEAAACGRAVCLYRAHRTLEARAVLGALVARNPRLFQMASYHLMTLNNLDTVTRDELWQAHLAFGREAGAPKRVFARKRGTEPTRLRVGFLSCDLKGHSVTYFLKPLLKGAAEAGVDVLLYHDHGKEDAVSEELKTLAVLWRNVSGQLDAAVEERIVADAPDVLVDLAGHTGNNRLAMLAHRLAPVQVSYLGYPNTTGVQAMDYRLVDPRTDPAGEADPIHSEKLVRFSDVAWCYEPPADAPSCREEPKAGGAAGRVVFGCFNHATKITDTMMRAWARILAGSPSAMLRIKSPGLEHPAVREPFMARLATAGADLSRIEILGTTPTVAEHLALYRDVDVALDTSPYNGTTTTCEALWMGVPVVTLAGDRHAARVGLSLLTCVGRTEWIAGTIDEYVKLAVRLGRGGEGLPAGRGGAVLREDMRRSLLLDQQEQARRFWAAIRNCARGE